MNLKFKKAMAEVLEGYAMSNRILLTLDGILRNDLELQDFTIISTETNNLKNKSPVLYESHNLGLESWCIKPVYQYVCNMLFSRRKQLAERKLPYNEMENLNCLLNGALLINPDVNTFWNMKRELLNNDILNVEGELHFSKIVLTHKSKSNEAFAYRRWLIKKILDKFCINKVQIPTSVLQNELSVTHMASEKSQNNYHSWNHRIWCIENISNLYPAMGNIIHLELSYTEDWISRHISEHSGYYYRQYLINVLRENKNISIVYENYYSFIINKLQVFKEDKYINLLNYLLGNHKKRILEETCSYINYVCVLLYDLMVLFVELFPHFFDHQCLYYHRRFLIYHLLRVPFEYHGIQYPKYSMIVTNINLWDENVITSDTVNISPSNMSLKFFKHVCNYQYPLIDIVTSNEKSFIADKKNDFIQEYHKWLKNIIGFE